MWRCPVWWWVQRHLWSFFGSVITISFTFKPLKINRIDCIRSGNLKFSFFENFFSAEFKSCFWKLSTLVNVCTSFPNVSTASKFVNFDDVKKNSPIQTSNLPTFGQIVLTPRWQCHPQERELFFIVDQLLQIGYTVQRPFEHFFYVLVT